MAVSDSGPDTVNKKLLYWSKTQPDKPAFIFHDPATATNKRLVFTRADIFTMASRYAAILRREGIRQGDVVCNTLPNSPERLLTDLGIMLAGAVAMNSMVFLSDGADFVGSIRRGRCVAVIVDPKEKSNQPLTVLENRLRSRAAALSTVRTPRFSRRCSMWTAVQTILMNDLVPFVPTPRVFLKMDIERFEWIALHRADRFFAEVDVPYILMEWMHYATVGLREQAAFVIRCERFILMHSRLTANVFSTDDVK
nr:hypothetical protein BaRGS_004797 [Batillaria attramentaria]